MYFKNQSYLAILLLFIGITFISCDDTTDESILTDESVTELSLDSECNLLNPSETVNETEINLLLQMREEEKLARDVYNKMYKLYGLAVFSNIARSEQKHMDEVLCLLNEYNIEDPAADTADGVFQNEVLQDLYDALIEQGSISLIDGLKVGATIEDVDIFDLMEFEEQTENPAIIAIFDNLTCGSRNHMRAFISQLEINNSTYTPQFIDEILFDDIINGSHEQCNN